MGNSPNTPLPKSLQLLQPLRLPTSSLAPFEGAISQHGGKAHINNDKIDKERGGPFLQPQPSYLTIDIFVNICHPMRRRILVLCLCIFYVINMVHMCAKSHTVIGRVANGKARNATDETHCSRLPDLVQDSLFGEYNEFVQYGNGLSPETHRIGNGKARKETCDAYNGISFQDGHVCALFVGGYNAFVQYAAGFSCKLFTTSETTTTTQGFKHRIYNILFNLWNTMVMSHCTVDGYKSSVMAPILW